jgi:hypothetical protein
VGGDAIFSLVPGALAVYFFHEGEVWLRQSQQPTSSASLRSSAAARNIWHDMLQS